jgi:hypothetical protein
LIRIALILGLFVVWSFNVTFYHSQLQIKLLTDHGARQDKGSTYFTKLQFQAKNLTLESLQDLTDDDLVEATDNSTSLAQARQGKEPLIEILKDAGVNDIDFATLRQLPKWSAVQELYGEGPIVFGLDQCQTFRDSTPPEKRSVGPAGLFNSGTNVLSLYLEANCYFVENQNGIQWQVPWGKHVMASLRGRHFVPNKESFDVSTILPIVTIRDPYSWMKSMCRHGYGLRWHHRPEHCPNLVPNEHDYSLFAFPGKNIPVRISWDNEHASKWNSMAHLWSDWNLQYYGAQDFPKLIIRFEDLIFHPKEVITQICECAGGSLRKDKFLYILDSAKFGSGHGAAKTTLASAMIRYGRNKRVRTKGLTEADISLAKHALDPELMEVFHYL